MMPRGRPRRAIRPRRRQSSLLPLLILLVLIALIVGYFFLWQDDGSEAYVSQDVYVHFIDVGQGDSTLIVTSGGTVLIDGGDNHMGTRVVNYLRNANVNTLSYVVATHPHADHIGGLIEVVNQFEIGAIMMPPVAHTTNTFERFIDAIELNNIPVVAPELGGTFSLGGAVFTILGPDNPGCGNLNNCSIVLRMDYGNNSFLFTADIEVDVENRLVENFNDYLSVDVLRVAHHGSRTSTSTRFLEAVDPQMAVISLGANNNFGHPHEVVMQRLTYKDIYIFRTDYQGHIVMSTDGTTISVSGGNN